MTAYGLAKLIAWHPEVLPDLQDVLSEMNVVSRSDNRIKLASSGKSAAGVRLDWDGKTKRWLISAFLEGQRREERSTLRLLDIWADASSAPPPNEFIAGPTSEVQQPAENDTATPLQEGGRRSEKSSRRLADLGADRSASASPPKDKIDDNGEGVQPSNDDADAGKGDSLGTAPNAATQLQEGSDPDAAVRSHGIPAGAASIYAYRNDVPIKAHADYSAAKAGDAPAAARLVEAVTKPEILNQVKAAFGKDVVFVAPMAEEATGRNAIPGALSWLLAAVTGGTADTDIVQSSRAYHTGARPLDRLLGRPLFSGPMRAGAKYVLVDDVSVMGGTLAEMANHIRANGGEVAGVVTLVNASRTLHIAPTKSQVKEIERRFGDVVRETFGVEPAALTGDEANFLLNVRDADTLRDRVAKAASERERRLFQKGVRASGAEEQREISDIIAAGRDASPGTAPAEPSDARESRRTGTAGITDAQTGVEKPITAKAPDPATRTDSDLKSMPPPARDSGTALYDWGRASVLDAGRRTGHEYVMAIDGDGSIIEYGSAGRKNYSGMNDKLFGAMMNRDRNALVIHNHPQNTPLSLADIAALAHPGMHAIWAIGHDGRDTRASLTPAARDRFVGPASSVDDQLSTYSRLPPDMHR